MTLDLIVERSKRCLRARPGGCGRRGRGSRGCLRAV